MKDLTRTQTVTPNATLQDVQKWITRIANRGNFDWCPTVPYHTKGTLLASVYDITTSYADVLTVTYVPRVRSRVVCNFMVNVVSVTEGFNVIAGCYTTPAPLLSSPTDQTVTLPLDYIRSAGYTDGVSSFRYSCAGTNVFDLAAGCTYVIGLRVKELNNVGLARLTSVNSLTVSSFPLLSKAGRNNLVPGTPPEA